MTGALLVPQVAHAATPLTGQVTYNGGGASGVIAEFYHYDPLSGFWNYEAQADMATDASGSWSYSGTLSPDGTYAMYYYTRNSTAIYSRSQGTGGITNSDKLVGQFTVASGVASVAAIPSTPLAIDAGAVAVTIHNGLTGAVLTNPPITSATAAVYDGYSATGQQLNSASFSSGAAFAGTVTIPGVQAGTFYDVYANSIAGYDSSDNYPAAGVNVVVGQTTAADVNVWPSGTPYASTLVSAQRTVTITGAAKVGTLLTASIPATTATVTWRWYSNDREIPGATAATYIPTASDLNSTIYARATVSAPGYQNDYIYISDDPQVVQVGDPNQAALTVSGTATFGNTLKATVIGGEASASSSFQWYRNGAPIAASDGSSYTLTKTDVGQTLFASVTSVVQGHTNAVIPSNTVAIARDKATIAFSAKTSISKSSKLKVKVNLTDGTTKNAATGVVKVYYSSKKFKTATFSATTKTKTVTLPKLSKGKHTIKITYAGDTHYSAKSTSFKVTVK